MQLPGARRLAMTALAAILAACSTPAGSSSPDATAAAMVSPAASLPIATVPQETAGTTPVASPTAAPTATLAAPTAAPEVDSPPEVGFANEFVMKVLVSDLNVRAKASTSSAKMGKAPKGALFLMSDWPVKANGYTWYFCYQLVLAKPGVLPDLPKPIVAGGYDGVLSGWLATGSEANPFLLPVAPRCPATRDLANLQAMLDSERASCFGTEQIELTGTYGCGGCGGINPGDYTPAWLADPLGYSFLSIDPSKQIGPLAVHFPPTAPAAPDEGSIIKVTGHFHDSRASTCVIAPMGETSGTPEAIASAVAKAYCEARFVVDTFTVVGTDPRFPN